MYEETNRNHIFLSRNCSIAILSNNYCIKNNKDFLYLLKVSISLLSCWVKIVMHKKLF